jgi:hypothetical protein
MKVAITGSTGLVGTPLVAALQKRGDQTLSLVRRVPRRDEELEWDPTRGVAQPERLGALDACVHLAGENIAARRWSPEQKERIRRSRTEGTARLVEALLRAPARPQVFVSASAIGFYGSTGDQEVDESSQPGKGFLPEVCQAWEAAAAPLREAGVRVVHVRFGVILARHGGALGRMLTPFRLGLGGKVGSGAQWMSWIALSDAVGVLLHALDTPGLSGPVNAVAPEPLTNTEFTRALGRALKRPTVFPLPAFAARLAFGELADDLLLASARVRPAVLQRSGYRYQDPGIDGALAALLGTSP